MTVLLAAQRGDQVPLRLPEAVAQRRLGCGDPAGAQVVEDAAGCEPPGLVPAGGRSP